MLDARTSLFTPESALDTSNAIGSSLRRRLSRWLPTLSKNLAAPNVLLKMADSLGQNTRAAQVLVIGGATSGVGLNVLAGDARIELTETDVYVGPRTSLVCDAHNLPFVDGLFDGVIIQAVLEHVLNPDRCVAEIGRVLRPGGLVYSDIPFMQPVHMGRYDFTRFTHLGHRWLFRDFEELAMGASGGPAAALAWSYLYFCRSLVRGRTAARVMTAFAHVTAFWLKYLDDVTMKSESVYDYAAGYYFLGRKASMPLSSQQLLRKYRGLVG